MKKTQDLSKAKIMLLNNTGGRAFIQFYHQNRSNPVESISGFVEADEQLGPFTVNFEEGWLNRDYWSVIINVENGPNPGYYQSYGSEISIWYESRLTSDDAGTTLSFIVNTNAFAVVTSTNSNRTPMTRLRDYSKVQNVFVLMLENHSFDNIFGQSGIPGIQHATTRDFNVYTDVHGNPKQAFVSSPAPTRMPTDPGHEFPDVVTQLGGKDATFPHNGPYPAINNSGFAYNYQNTQTEGPRPENVDVPKIMLGFDTQNQLPVLYTLATEFAICDHWYSSLPGPTWPNRFFLHGASSSGLDVSPAPSKMKEWETVAGFQYQNGSIFDRLGSENYALYNDYYNSYSDSPATGLQYGGYVPQVGAISGIHWSRVVQDVKKVFVNKDIVGPYSKQYTFIEPNYGDIYTNSYKGGSSQHPMDNVYGGENLIKGVYEAIRNSAGWENSLLIITYDEHGGFYDSAKPHSPAVPPGDTPPVNYNENGFDFKLLGVRVPAIVISPYIPKGTVDPTIYDHSSVAATLCRLFNHRPLTNRDRAANDLKHLLSMRVPRTDTPTSLPSPVTAEKRRGIGRIGMAKLEKLPKATSGNTYGFMQILLKAEIELSDGKLGTKKALIRNFHQLETIGDVRKYSREVMKKVKKARTAYWRGLKKGKQ